MLNRDEYRQMLLAGTVSFPATFPQVGRLGLKTEKVPSTGPDVTFLSVTESPSARVTLERKVIAKSVRAVFIPRDPCHVNYADGQWLLGEEVQSGLEALLAKTCLDGIVFVPESEPSLLNVSAGMTAGESVQYYPPLPNDPAHNHYNAWPPRNVNSTSTAPGASVGDQSCADLHAEYLERAWSCSDRECEVLDSSDNKFPTTARGLNANVAWSCNGFPADM